MIGMCLQITVSTGYTLGIHTGPSLERLGTGGWKAPPGRQDR